MKLVANGQLPAVAAALYTQATSAVPPLNQASITAQNVGGSAETITFTLTPLGGTARRVGYAVLQPNEQFYAVGIPMGPGDALNGSSTDASVVDYTVSLGFPSNDVPFSMWTLDATGAVKSSQSFTTSSAQTITSTSAAALVVGANGATHPVLQVDASASSVASGIKITGAAAAGGVSLAAISSNATEVLKIDALGAAAVNIGSVSTGGILLSDSVTFADAKNITLNTTTGTKIGTTTTGKLALFNATPIVQPANTVDYLAGLVNLGLRASGGTAALAAPGLISSSSATGGIGYATGSGGTVAQASSRTTGVTLNTVTGTITLVSAAGSATPATFTVTNSAVAATDTVIVSQKSGTDAYTATVSAVGAGSFKITVVDLTGTTTETPAFSFAVFKGVAA